MLTDAQVRKIKPLDKKKRYSDEKGLYLEVTPSGGRFWRLKYRFNGRESTLTIGSYPEITLAQARRARDEARIQLYNNIDPNAIKNARLQQLDESTLFRSLAMEWMEDRKPVIKEGTYLRDLSVFEKDLFPVLGHMPIDQIKGKDVLACAKQIEARGAQEMAKRSIPLAGRIFRFAIGKGIIENDPTPHLQEALKPRKVKHMARLDISEFPPFLERMDHYHGNILVKTALQFMTLTFVRTAELINMEWDEIDFENKVWLIPAYRMKRRKELMVPLSPQVYDLFMALFHTRSDDGFIFKHTREPWKHMTSETPLAVIKRNGYANEMVTHGFRTLFSTHANESKLFRAEVIDYQIAHVNKTTKVDKTSKIYNRAEYWPERVELMNWYANVVSRWM